MNCYFMNIDSKKINSKKMRRGHSRIFRGSLDTAMLSSANPCLALLWAIQTIFTVQLFLSFSIEDITTREPLTRSSWKENTTNSRPEADSESDTDPIHSQHPSSPFSNDATPRAPDLSIFCSTDSYGESTQSMAQFAREVILIRRKWPLLLSSRHLY